MGKLTAKKVAILIPKDLETFNKRIIEEIAKSNYANSPVL
jgi:hypothetical protein